MVTLPQTRPSNGGAPISLASATPMPFCATAKAAAAPQKSSTCAPPRRTSSQRAFRPMHAKKATRNGVFTCLPGAWNHSGSAVTSQVHQRAVTWI